MSGLSASSRDGVGTTGSVSAGCFIEHAHLAQLSTTMKAINAGDRIVKGRLELFACSRRNLTKRQEEEIQRRAPECINVSPFGPLRDERAQLLLANLTSLMALLFTDYDCTALTPLDFEHCSDKNAVMNTINQSLALIVDRMHSGFLKQFWQTVKEAIDLRGCDIYSLRPSTFEPADNSLMSFNYFFVDTGHGRILFIGSVTKSKASKRGRTADTDSDVSISQHDTNSNSSKEQDSMGSSLHEGEYCLSSDGGDDEMLD